MITTIVPISIQAKAKSMTSLGFAEQGIKAYNEGWNYVYGGKGEEQNGVRVSDCAGLLYSYFSDMGVGGCMGSCTAQVNNNCLLSGKIDGSLPRIHGLSVTMYETIAPETGIYGHVGIYIGGEEVCDNSDYSSDMLRMSVFSRDWTEWHLFDNGLKYPSNGWYEFDNKMVHYSNYEYDINTSIDGYIIDNNGFALNPDGSYAEIDNSLLSNKWVDASVVKDYLLSIGWAADGGNYVSGPNNNIIDINYNAVITANSVNLRESSTTSSKSIAVLGLNERVEIIEEVKGVLVKDGKVNSSVWYKVNTCYGFQGYVSALYVQKDFSLSSATYPVTPVITVEDGEVSISSDGDGDIFYTKDCSSPIDNGILYTNKLSNLGYTYSAVSKNNNVYSEIAELSVCSNGSVFTDFKFSDWYAENIDKCVKAGLMNGTGNQKFSPLEDMNRAQFVVVLARMLNIDLSKYNSAKETDRNKLPFVDVAGCEYYAPAVQWAYENNIVNGVGNNKFEPLSSITREQACVILANYFKWQKDVGIYLFKDHSTISDWAKEQVYICRSMGIVDGVGNNLFEPQGILSRAQGATMLIHVAENEDIV